MTDPTQEAVPETVTGYLDEQGIEHEPGARSGEVVATLPGEKKLKTVVSLVTGEHDLSVSAFVIRHPDENHDRFHRYLLRRNLRLRGIAYAIDAAGDVFVTGRLPLAAVDAEHLDQLLGAVLAAADDPFNDLLVIGFITSMRKEWAWRISRGESTRNLEAFRGILEGTEDPDLVGEPTDSERPAPAQPGH